MTVSVLIPAHNEEKVLRECLDSIMAQNVPIDQVVVVADTCTDSTAAVARAYGAVVVETDCKAKAAAQNAGLPYVTGEYLVCVDADTVLAPNVVGLFLDVLRSGRADATCANMLPMPSQRGFWVASRRFAYALGRYWWRWCQDQVGRLMVLSGCAYALRTEVVRERGFPGGLITCDMDLTWDLYQGGYRTYFCHKALAYTYDPETFRVYSRQMMRWASGFYQNFAKHRRQVFSHPASMLVVGSTLLDLLTLPVGYGLAIAVAAHNPGSAHWLWQWFLVHAAATIFIASRTIGWKQAVASFPAYWLVNWLNKSIYLWTFLREWGLGKHYASWTGRQGRAMVITPMPRGRKLAFALTLASLPLLFT